ncbi:MAG: GDSL-type esterase/lipase family protein [Actinobacteria bacterium]|nr:GDSL-type esterase/lipase family protein [Actinomycetota bacterium]
MGVLLVTALSLGAAEVALRLADYPPAAFSPWIRSDRLGFRLAPGIRLRMREPEYDVEIATNSLGLRDEEPGPTSGPRVLLLGDSFVMGYGVHRGELFADLLEKDLGADVVNAGTGGYEIVQQERVLEDLAPLLKPDLVVYALYLGNDLAQNDEWEERADGSLHNRVRQYPVRQPWEFKLRRLVRDTLYGLRKGRSEKDGEWLPYEGYLGLCERELADEARRDYREADELLGRLASRSRELGLPLLVLLLPYRPMVEPEALEGLARRIPELATRYDLGRPAREIGALLDTRGIAWADATAYLAAEHRRSGEELFYPVDGHLTAKGHRAVAEFALPLVRERLSASRHL